MSRPNVYSQYTAQTNIDHFEMYLNYSNIMLIDFRS